MTEEQRSPRLELLRADLARRGPSALTAFWQEIEQKGAPLIEPEENGTHSLVTFLWRESAPVQSIGLSAATGEELTALPTLQPLDGTDLWYRTVRLRNDYRAGYFFIPDHELPLPEEAADPRAALKKWKPDPLNPRVHIAPPDPDEPRIPAIHYSILELPEAPPQPWSMSRPGLPTGTVEAHRFASTVLANERGLYIYLPPGYEPGGAPYDLLLTFDGWYYMHGIDLPVILDNLIAAGRIPPMVAVGIGNPNMDVRMAQLPYHPPLVQMLATELMPWVRARYNVTHDPARTVLSGASYGGLASAYAALEHPGIFGNVLSQAGTFQWAPEGEPEPEWHAQLYLGAPPLPIRFHLCVGLLEYGGSGHVPTQVNANRHFRDIQRAKGYSVTYAEYMTAHEDVSFQSTLPDGLLALMGAWA